MKRSRTRASTETFGVLLVRVCDVKLVALQERVLVVALGVNSKYKVREVVLVKGVEHALLNPVDQELRLRTCWQQGADGKVLEGLLLETVRGKEITQVGDAADGSANKVLQRDVMCEREAKEICPMKRNLLETYLDKDCGLCCGKLLLYDALALELRSAKCRHCAQLA